MKFILIILFSFNLYALDNSCFGVFKYKSYDFPYSYSKKVQYSSKSIAKRNVSSISELKLGTYNLENFSSKSVILSQSEVKNKTIKIMSAVSESNLDILAMQEVLDPDYLIKAVKDHLGDKYKVLFIENQGVADNIAFIVKKDLPFTYDLHSMKDYKFGDRVAFNKDFPILEVKLDDEPIMFFGGLHLKSKFGGSNKNNFFEDVRDRQIRSILNIKQKIEKNYSSAPFIIGGDFNNNILDKPAEFKLLEKFMTDSFELSSVGPKSRLTNITNYKGKRITGQLDGIFVSNSSLDKVNVNKTYVHQFKNDKGYFVKLEDSRTSRDMMPSDHSMVITSIDFPKLIGGTK